LLGVVGDAGAVFVIRVVLNATTTVVVESGSVEVRAMAGGQAFNLRAGQRARLDGRGRWQVDEL
jgi:ferric-dicitrate binding protein FerR (iron transport regulator)